jgi:hypothetical protein
MARFELGLLIEGVPAEVDSSVTKSPGNLDSPVMSFITEDSRTPTKELDKATPADLLEGGKTVGGRKGLFRVVDGSWKTDASLGQGIQQRRACCVRF